jgi:hypothetical protein
MRFLIIPTPAPGFTPPLEPHAFDEKTFSAYMKYNEDMHVAGVLVASEGLLPGVTGAHIAVRSGQRTVTDGPFAESKELVGGFWLVDVKSKADAIDWALRCPINPVCDEVIEIRQLTGESDIPQALVQLCRLAAPTWSESWAARSRSAS